MGERQRQLWERKPGERSRPYAAFCIYRDLGPERSLTKAVEVFLTVVGDKGATKRARQQRRFLTHPNPATYKRSLRKHWGRWSRKWEWVRRAQAWDDHVHELAESERLESQLHLKQQEIEETEKQRKLRLEEARALRTGGRRVWARFLRLVDAGEVDRMVLERVRNITVLREKGGSETRIERQIKGIADLLELAEKAIELGQKLERQEIGDQPAPGPSQFLMSEKEVEALAAAITRYVPEERWEEAADEVARVLRNPGEGVQNSNG